MSNPARSARSGNNFDVLRLMGAFLVALGHALSLFFTQDWLSRVTQVQSFGAIGLAIFCIISGYLITQSRTRNIAATFAQHRALRIFPALVVAIPVMAFVMGPLVTTLPARLYFTSGTTWQFVTSILVFPLNPVLPGVFGDVSLIGQLYSLTAELLFYILAGLFGVWRRFPLLTGVLLLGVWSFLILNNYATLPFDRVFALQVHSTVLFFFPVRLSCLCLFYLLAGSAIANLKIESAILSRLSLPFCVVWIAAMLSKDRRAYDMVEMALLPVIVIGFGLARRLVVRLPAWLGDISYGTYIYHLAVIEFVYSIAAPSRRNSYGVTASLILSAVAGWVSFHLIEKQALSWKRGPTTKAGSSQPATVPALH